MAELIERLGSSASARIKNALTRERQRYQAQGRKEPTKLAKSVESAYGFEVVMRGLQGSVLADAFVVKGGTLWRAWEEEEQSGALVRPTMDIDLHTENTDMGRGQMVGLLMNMLQASSVCEKTGMERFSPPEISDIKESKGLDCFRLKTVGYLASASGNAREIEFEIEVNRGPMPEDCWTWRDLTLQFDAREKVRLRVAKPEWMLADKLHASASRGLSNSRLKDFYDILMLRRRVDPAEASRLFADVWNKEPATAGKIAMPETYLDIPSFTRAFLDRDKETFWRRRIEEWAGEFKSDRDPDLALTIGSCIYFLESAGVLNTSPAGDLAISLMGAVERYEKEEMSLDGIDDLIEVLGKISTNDDPDVLWDADRIYRGAVWSNTGAMDRSLLGDMKTMLDKFEHLASDSGLMDNEDVMSWIKQVSSYITENESNAFRSIDMSGEDEKSKKPGRRSKNKHVLTHQERLDYAIQTGNATLAIGVLIGMRDCPQAECNVSEDTLQKSASIRNIEKAYSAICSSRSDMPPTFDDLAKEIYARLITVDKFDSPGMR